MGYHLVTDARGGGWWVHQPLSVQLRTPGALRSISLAWVIVALPRSTDISTTLVGPSMENLNKTKYQNQSKRTEQQKEEEVAAVEATSILDEIRQEREELEEFLLSESNKVTKAVTKFVLAKWTAMENKVQKIILEKEALGAAYQESVRARGRTYAQAAASSEHRATAAKTRREDGAKPSEVLILKPKSQKDTRTNDDIRVDVTKALSHKRKDIKVRNIRQIRDKGILIEVHSKEDVKKVKETDFENINVNVTVPKKIDPSIIIYDVEREWKADELREEFVSKNFEDLPEEELRKLAKKVVFRHAYKTKNVSRQNWIVQLPAKLFEKITKEGRSFMLWRTYKLKEYINIARCYKCHMYGHVAKHCKAEGDMCETCGGTDHKKEKCGHRDNPQCPNCVKRKRKDVCHSVRSTECPEYQRQVALYRNKIKWS